MNTSKKILLGLTMIAGLGAINAVIPAVAGMGDHQQGSRVERLAEKLDLSEQQSNDIKQLISESSTEAQRPSKEQRKQKRMQHRADLQAFFNAPEFDETAVREKMIRRNQQHQDKMVARMKMQHAIYQILNEQQRQKYLKLVAHRMGKMNYRKH